MAAAKFNTGDQVQLKSGGPCMTVNLVSEARAGFQLSCVWYHSGKMETITLFEDAVKPYTAEEPPGFFVG